MKQMLANPAAVHLILGVLGVVALLSVLWLGFILTQPARWAALVDKENDFWVGKGLISASASQWFRRFEKGPGQKILVGVVALLSVSGFIYLVMHFAHHR